MSNVARTTTVAGDMDAEALVLKSLPDAVRAFVEERAAVPFAPSQVAGYLRPYGEKATLSKLRELSDAEMTKVFGKNYPLKDSKECEKALRP